MGPRWARRLVLVALLLGGLAGCSSQPGGADRSAPAGGEARPTGKVTDAVYEAAVGRFAECLAAEGIELLNEGWDPVDHEKMMLRYSAPAKSANEVGKVTKKCRAAHLDAVADAYTQDNASLMAPDLMTAVRGCLAEKGIEISGKERNPEDLLRAVPGEDELRTCVHASAGRLYPELSAVVFP
ncbi:hypothetical protein [Streptomyces sp. NBC_01233]|uniref:hypothetical protein n=1 Tax=Streptomyces sp. NBC_01233 TaxID=2903787 RepID=UPI002E147A8E|nr:hypothetical protein OG332_44710 [Streptomyces sp. NBC_01233]